MNKHSDELSLVGFTSVQNVLTSTDLSRINTHCTKKIWSSDADYVRNEKLGPEKNTRNVYGDTVTDKLLERLRPKVESMCNKALIPTYSFFRFYPKNTGLGKHKDRPACEYTMTLCLSADHSNLLDSDPEYAWPIYIAGTPCVTKPGDGILYKGHEMTHWRTPLKGKFQLQLFLHYIDANGPFAAEHAFDMRSALGQPTVKSNAKELSKHGNTTHRIHK